MTETRPHTLSAGPARTALVVAGMHRSGTSAMARVLGLAGGDMPDRLIHAGEDNPLGFWEPRDMVSLNDEILRSIGSAWDDVFGFRADALAQASGEDFLARARSVVALNYAETTLAVVKDPRVSLLVSVWRRALDAEGLSPVFVIMVRDPLEVARSIAARDRAPIQRSMLAWLSHMIAVERDTRGARRVFVSYADLVEDWRPVLDRVRRELAMPLPVSARQAGEISDFLTPSARHHAAPEAGWVDRTDIWPGVAAAWRWLKLAAQATEALPPFPETIVNDLADLEAQFGPVLKAQAAEAALRQQQMQAMIADRETTVLRLRAQAREYKTDVATRDQALSDAQAQASATQAELQAALDAARDRDALTAKMEEQARAASQRVIDLQAALDALTARMREEADAATQRDIDLRAALDALSAGRDEDASAANQRETDLQSALEALEARRVEEAHAAAQRDADLQAAIGALNDRCETLDARLAAADGQAADLQMERDAAHVRAVDAEARVEILTKRLDDILSSASWGLTRPVRVATKRLKALNRDR